MKSVLFQILCCTLISILSFIMAVVGVWPSYTITVLKGPDSPIGYSITSRDANLIGSLPLLGSFIGTVVGGFISEALGRKRTEILCGLIIALSWSLVATAKSIALLLVARLIVGIAGGVHVVTALVYINEISQPSICGFTTNIIFSMYSVGTLASYLLGWFCSYHFICYLNLSLAVAFVVLMCFMRDSPGYLVGRGKEEEALLSLRFYRGLSKESQDVVDELAYIKSQRKAHDGAMSGPDDCNKSAENEKLKPADEKQIREESSPWKILRTSKSSQRAFITTAVIIILTSCSGVSAIQTYAGQLFLMASPGLSPDFWSVALAVTFTVCGGVGGLVIDMFGRRTLLLFSSVASTLFLFLLGTTLKWQWAPEWGVPCLTLLFCAAFQIGANNIPFVQLGESLMPQVKSLGASVATSCLFTSSFVTVSVFLPCSEHLGLHSTFFMYTAISAASTVFIYLVAKETRGVKFEAVKDMYEKGYLCRYPIKSYD